MSGTRSRSPPGSAAAASAASAGGMPASSAAAHVSRNNANGSPHLAAGSHHPPAPPGPDAPEVPHPHFLKSPGAAPKVDQPVTASVASAMPRGTWIRRVAMAFLRADTNASVVLHKASLFPFDLALVPFAMVCGIYSMPALIPLVGFVESPRLAMVILASTLLTTACTTFGKRNTKRMRPAPTSLARKFFNLRRLEHNFSFPSGDSAQGAVVAISLYLYATGLIAAMQGSSHTQAALSVTTGGSSAPFPPATFLLLLPLVMTARVYFGAHWWSDTVGGAAIGSACTFAGWALLPAMLGWRIGEAGGSTGGHDAPLLGTTPVMQWLGFRQK